MKRKLILIAIVATAGAATALGVAWHNRSEAALHQHAWYLRVTPANGIATTTTLDMRKSGEEIRAEISSALAPVFREPPSKEKNLNMGSYSYSWSTSKTKSRFVWSSSSGPQRAERTSGTTFGPKAFYFVVNRNEFYPTAVTTALDGSPNDYVNEFVDNSSVSKLRDMAAGLLFEELRESYENRDSYINPLAR